LDARQQTIAMLDIDTGKLVEKTLEHDGERVSEFYAALSDPVLEEIRATGSMHWFLKLMEKPKINCRVGHPAKIGEAATRKQKHDRPFAIAVEATRGKSLTSSALIRTQRDGKARFATSTFLVSWPSSPPSSWQCGASFLED
jgi:hypothetical protein